MNIDAIVITYNPDPERISENLKLISRNFRKVIVLDNNSSNRNDWLHRIENRIKTILLDHNYGIAHSTNVGIVLLDFDCDWFGLFDQDTLIPDDYVYQMFYRTQNRYMSHDVAVLVPSFNYLGNATYSEQTELKEVDTAIASGSLIKKHILKIVGTFDDKYFIDYVDTEFFLRTRSKGFKIIKVEGILLGHVLGNMKKYKLLGLKVFSSNHNASRKYYIYRNRIHTFPNYYRKFPTWAARDIARGLSEMTKIILFEDEKTSKIRMAIRGFVDGVKGKYGELK